MNYKQTILIGQVAQPRDGDELPPLPEPEGAILKNHLKQVNQLKINLKAI